MLAAYVQGDSGGMGITSTPYVDMLAAYVQGDSGGMGNYLHTLTSIGWLLMYRVIQEEWG